MWGDRFVEGSVPSDGKTDAVALSVHGLSKRFGDRVAFQDVSFAVGHGEIFGFLGPNGAGKTTTVRTLGTLIAPTSGSATVAGIPLTPENGVEIRGRISIMPESPGLYLRLSVRENLECFADLYEVPDSSDRIRRALRAINLTDRRRVRAIVRKELREYRRSRSVVLAMAILPLIFLIQPLVAVLLLNSSDASQLSHRHLLLYMLGIPALVPAAVSAASVVGERQQGTLEPVLTTPIGREELVVGKALAPLLPSVAIACAVYAFFIVCVELLADPGVAPALIRGPDILAQLIFTPLIAAWSIWLAIAISARSSDIRVAQQLEPPVSRRGHSDRVRGDPRHARPWPRPRGGAAARQPTRLATRLGEFRPRTAHDEYQVRMRRPGCLGRG
jgi:ABC-type lipopolysaccharide export system ATPase subunit